VGRGFQILICAGLIFQASGALADSWSIVEGRIAVKKGKNSPLSGAFEASLSESDPEDGTGLALDDFAFTAGRRELTPRIPVEYDGLLPVAWLELADQIHLEGDQVTAVHVRTGGKLVDESDDEVTFRFLELRADAEDGGYAVGRLRDTELPRRLVLQGDVYEVEQSFGLPGASCGQPPPPVGGIPGSGSGSSSGGVIVIGNAGLLEFGTLDVASFGRRTFVWESSAGATVLQGRTSGSASSIEGALYTSSNAVLTPVEMRFETVRYYSLALDGPPTLEQLGMRAPDGAVIQADASGAVRVSSAGDLFVEGVLPAGPISDLTSVTLSTPGNIVVTGRLELGSASLRLEAGGEVHIDTPDGGDPGEDIVIVAPDAVSVGLPDYCQGLAPILPAEERRVGRFSLVASAARQVKVDVQPVDVQLAPTRKRIIIPGSDQRIRAVLYGSRSLDVHDVDRDGRLLGRGEAETIHPGLRVFAPMNGDRYRDLVTYFLVRDTEIAYGDREVCLVARTLDGELLEGCDKIDVMPPALQGPH